MLYSSQAGGFKQTTHRHAWFSCADGWLVCFGGHGFAFDTAADRLALFLAMPGAAFYPSTPLGGCGAGCFGGLQKTSFRQKVGGPIYVS